MHKSILEQLGYDESTESIAVIKDWKNRTKNLCKPCWEIHYCPYGPLVEDFPLLPMLRKDIMEHHEYLKECLKTGVLASGETLTEERRKLFIGMIGEDREEDFPEEIPNEISQAACLVYGHMCPVFFVAEPLTETKKVRKHSRTIPRDVMIKVIRRDGQVCQKCGELVPDDEVEFDHIIPYSKGGTSTEENLRVVHKECNRKKSNSLDEILHDNPIEHYFSGKLHLIKKNSPTPAST